MGNKRWKVLSQTEVAAMPPWKRHPSAGEWPACQDLTGQTVAMGGHCLPALPISVHRMFLWMPKKKETEGRRQPFKKRFSVLDL